jgi:hypothetical protein
VTSKKRHLFLIHFGAQSVRFEAISAWTWSNFLHAQASEKAPLCINVDETNVRLFPEQGAGYVSSKASSMKRSPRSLVYSCSRGTTRSSLSYVCFITDDATIQPLLPQVLMVSKKVVSVRDVSTVRETLPDNIVLWHGDSSWTSTTKMIALIDLLVATLKEKLSERQIILSADCYRAHITQPVWNCCKDRRVFYCIIPAKLTWALQPCDTHVFAKFKRELQQGCLDTMLRSPSGTLSVQNLFAVLIRTITDIVCTGDWRKAFTDTGFNGNQNFVSQRVWRKLGFATPPLVGHELPSLSMLQCLFPKNCIIPITRVFGCFYGNAEIVKASNLRERIRTRSVAKSDLAAGKLGSVASASSALLSCPPVLPPLPPPTTVPPPMLRLPSRSRLPRAKTVPLTTDTKV